MKKFLVQIVLLAGLVGLSGVAVADRDDQRSPGWNRVDSLQWRLQGRDIFFRAPGERQWRRAPGSAHDLADGWVIGTDRRNGGYGIYRWSGRDWHRMPGAGIDIGGSYNNPWVINDRGERFSWTGFAWREDNSYRRPDRGGRDERPGPQRGWDDRRDQDRDRRDRDDRGRDDRGRR